MKWVSGDFVDLAHKHKATGIAFTANAVIMKKDDQYKLVMGAGAAKRIRDKFLGIDAKLAEEIVKNVNDYPEHTRQVKDYYLSYCDYDNLRIFAVQTKKHFKEAGDWDLTVQSLEQLANYIKHNPESFKYIEEMTTRSCIEAIEYNCDLIEKFKNPPEYILKIAKKSCILKFLTFQKILLCNKNIIPKKKKKKDM